MAGIPGATPGSIGSFSELETPDGADIFEVESPTEGSRRVTRTALLTSLAAALQAAEIFVSTEDLADAVGDSLPDTVLIGDAQAGTDTEIAMWSAALVHAAAKRAARAIDFYSLPVTVTAGALDMAVAQSFTVSAGVGREVTITNAPTDRSAVLVVKVMGNDATTWPVGINWVGGVAPELGTNFTLVSILWHAGTYVGIRSAAFDS